MALRNSVDAVKHLCQWAERNGFTTCQYVSVPSDDGSDYMAQADTSYPHQRGVVCVIGDLERAPFMVGWARFDKNKEPEDRIVAWRGDTPLDQWRAEFIQLIGRTSKEQRGGIVS